MRRTILTGLAALALAHAPFEAQAAKECNFGKGIEESTYKDIGHGFEFRCYKDKSGELVGIGFPTGLGSIYCTRNWRNNGIISFNLIEGYCKLKQKDEKRRISGSSSIVR